MTHELKFDPLEQAEFVMAGLVADSTNGKEITDLDNKRQDMRDLMMMSIARSLAKIAKCLR